MTYTVTVHDPRDDRDAEVVERCEFSNRMAALTWPDDPPTPVAHYVANHRAAPAHLRRVSVRARTVEGHLVGIAGSVFDETVDDQSEVGWIGIDVDPEHRRHGVGSTLLATLLETLEGWGRQVVVAETVDVDPAGAAFAEALGAACQGTNEEGTIWAIPLDQLRQRLSGGRSTT